MQLLPVSDRNRDSKLSPRASGRPAASAGRWAVSWDPAGTGSAVPGGPRCPLGQQPITVRFTLQTRP